MTILITHSLDIGYELTHADYNLTGIIEYVIFQLKSMIYLKS